jgi:uncharacterized membrane protein YhaH (DUF805 family)
VTFVEAVIDAFGRYATFAGRTRRRDYWWYLLFVAIVEGFAAFLDRGLGTTVFLVFAVLALFLPTVSATVRRLHDTGRASGWVLFGLVPIAGDLALLVWAAQAGEPDVNAYGAPVVGSPIS